MIRSGTKLAHCPEPGGAGQLTAKTSLLTRRSSCVESGIYMIAVISLPFSNNLTDPGPIVIHWQLSQATSLHQVQIPMPKGKKVSLVGIESKNGSGNFVCGVDIFDGYIGSSTRMRPNRRPKNLSNRVTILCHK